MNNSLESPNRIAIITGSGGLIGSQSCDFFNSKGYDIIGIDNDMRSYFFGESASTKESIESIKSKILNYEHHSIDIRDYDSIDKIFKKYLFLNLKKYMLNL